MRHFLTLSSILGYLIGSIVVGYNQFKNHGELSTTFLATQWIVLGISTILTLSLQKSVSVLGETLATLGGGIALMIIIQAVIFYVLGGLINSNMNTARIVVFLVLALIIVRLVFKYLTKDV